MSSGAVPNGFSRPMRDGGLDMRICAEAAVAKRPRMVAKCFMMTVDLLSRVRLGMKVRGNYVVMQLDLHDGGWSGG